MKKALFIAVLMFSKVGVSFSKENGTQSFSGIMDEVKQYCSESGNSNSARCLSAYFTYRCTVNFIGSDPWYLDDCINATSDLVTELDLTQMESGSDADPLQLAQVAFSKKLIKQFLTPTSEFQTFIKKLDTAFNDSFENGRPHSLWLQVLAASDWNREKSLERMVTWFQDFSGPNFLALVESKAKSLKQKNHRAYQTLMENGTALVPFYDLLLGNRIQQNRNPQFQIYPTVKNVSHLSSMAHHFYTPAYLSMRLHKRGYSKEVAFFAAFLFNTTYEFNKLDRKMGAHRWPLQDPLPFQASKHSLQIEKIYTGYMGALFGVGMEDKTLNYQYFAKRLAADPSGFVSDLHYTRF